VLAVAAAAGALLSACAVPGARVEVTRFHAAPPASGLSIALVPEAPAETDGLAFRARAEALAAELAGAGFPPAPPESADLIGTLSARLATRPAAPAESPVRIGVGIGGGSRSGVSGGVSIATGVGAPRAREVVDAEMALVIRRRADPRPLWEGRAVASAVPLSGALDARALDRALARALVADFPGPSGRTQRVRVPL